jgi:hypothetical protein
MPDRVLDSHHEISTLRQLRVLVVLLILSNVALGIFGFYFLRAVDRKYSNLIEQSVPTMNDLQTLTAVSMDAMRSTNPILLGESGQNRAEIVSRARLALERDRDLRRQALKRESISTGADERLDFGKAGDTFTEKASEVVNLLAAGDSVQATRRREEVLRPTFDSYVAATTKAADILEAESLRTSENMTMRTFRMSSLLLGIGTWPVMILGTFLLIAALFVLGVLIKVLFSRGEAI